MSLPPQPPQFTLPHALLQPYISAFMFMQLDATSGNFSVDMFPVGYSVLSYAMDDIPPDFLGKPGPAPRFIIAGQGTKYHKQAIPKGIYRYVYVVFKPFGAYRLLNFKQNTIVDGYASIPDIFGDKVNGLCYALEASKNSPDEIIKLLEGWLLQQLLQNPTPVKMDEVIKACQLIEESNGSKTMIDLCQETGMSKSSIERHFLEKVGVSPKMYSRIIRFNSAYQTIQSGKYQNWQDVVYQYNFYDQAHFIKDFKSFFNRTPAEVYYNSLNSADLLKKEKA
jgi:AraC-like DNA-binding protein